MTTLVVSCRNRTNAEGYYVQALKEAGFVGDIRWATPGDPLPSWEGVSGVLLTGGADIDPVRWDLDEPVHPTAEVDGERDAVEVPLVQQAWERHLPILGICRGEQILNVALGGSMIQHVPEHFECEADRHQHGDPQTPDLRHGVVVDPTSRLASLLGSTEVLVNSRHHQAVKQVAPDLRAVAFHPETQRGPQALIEGIEATDPDRWVVGVQWHPENLVGLPEAAGQAARNLFAGFVQALNAPRPS